VVRQQATFSARCHLVDGQRRTFAFDRLAGIFDAGSGDAISLDAFRDNKQRRKAAAPG
jgi:hypothetical protein